jgi:hypothetical protein
MITVLLNETATSVTIATVTVTETDTETISSPSDEVASTMASKHFPSFPFPPSSFFCFPHDAYYRQQGGCC